MNPNFESVHNYYEHIVFEYIIRELIGEQGITDQEFLEDIACVALNQLPARYVRHNVDTAFYQTDREQAEMEKAVAEAVTTAAEHVRRHQGDQRPATIPHP